MPRSTSVVSTVPGTVAASHLPASKPGRDRAAPSAATSRAAPGGETGGRAAGPPAVDPPAQVAFRGERRLARHRPRGRRREATLAVRQGPGILLAPETGIGLALPSPPDTDPPQLDQVEVRRRARQRMHRGGVVDV